MKDELYGNKVAGALLAVALLFFAPPVIINTFSALGHHGGGHHDGEVDEANPLNLAYNPVDLVFGTANAASADTAKPDLGTLLAAASADKGARSAAICKSCHSFEEGGANGTGPNLWNIVGREVASVEGFGYSPAMQEYGGVWTYERLDGLLINSKSFLPGTSMAQKIRKEGKRSNILAFMQTLSSSPQAFPAPAASMEETSDE